MSYPATFPNRAMPVPFRPSMGSKGTGDAMGRAAGTRAGHRGRYGVWGLSGRGDGAAHGELRGRGSHGRGPRVSGSFFKRRGSES